MFNRRYKCTICKQKIANINFINETNISEEDNYIIRLLLESHASIRHSGLDVLFDIDDIEIVENVTLFINE